MIDHLAQIAVRNSSAQRHSVPVTFVHVIPGLHIFETIAKFKRAIWVAFQVRCRRNLVQRQPRKHFAADFEHQRVFAEGRAFGRA